MNDNILSEQTLTRNNIKKFLLKVEFTKDNKIKIPNAAEIISKYFDRTEKRLIKKLTLSFTQGSPAADEQEVFDFVLISESKSISLTFSEVQNAFWIESTQYKNRSIYKDIINKVVFELSSISQEIEAKRIGLRYINEFKCDNVNKINTIYGKRLSSILKSMMMNNNHSRVISVEEFNNDNGFKLRLQYGIPNKFYPSIITVYDLLLDIDSYFESTCKIIEWNDIITKLNHAAYDQFILTINQNYLKELK